MAIIVKVCKEDGTVLETVKVIEIIEPKHGSRFSAEVLTAREIADAIESNFLCDLEF